jgi:hypothetical protein
MFMRLVINYSIGEAGLQKGSFARREVFPYNVGANLSAKAAAIT